LGHEGVRACLNAGVNDLGGTLMNETITRAAGASHGQETSPEEMEQIIRAAGRVPVQRTTSYGQPAELQVQRSFGASTLLDPEYSAAPKYERKANTHKRELVRPGLGKTNASVPGDGDDRLSSADII
jgi:FO synthase